MAKLIQPSFTKGEVSPQVHGRVDAAMYREALRTGRNAIIHTYGGASNRPGTVFIGPVKDHTEENVRLIPFQFNTTDQYMLEFGNLYMRVIRNDGHVVETAVNISAITQSGQCKITTATAHGYANGDEVFLDNNIGGMIELHNRRVIVSDVTSTTFKIKDHFSGNYIDSLGFTAYTSGGTVARVFTLTTPYLSADLHEIKYVQSADTMTLTHPDYDPRDLTRTDHDVWSLTTITFTPTTVAPTGIAVTPDVAGTTSYTYGVSTINSTTFEESLVGEASTATGATTPSNVVSWTAAANALRYRVYRKTNGLFGFIGETEDVSFHDVNIIPDTLDGPQISRDPFSGVGNDPRAVVYYEQRLAFGGTINSPDTVFATRTGLRDNMSIRFPRQGDDAITIQLNANEVNEIRHLAAGEDLLIFTSGSEWRATSGGQGFAIENLQLKPQSEWGSSHLRPLRVGNEYIFAEDGNARCRTMAFDFAVDGYDGEDLTQLAGHLLAEEGPDEYIFRDWCFQYFPEPRLIAVRTDGMVLTMTYSKKQGVIAWTTWDTEGSFEATASLRRSVNTVEDGIYFVVKRRVKDQEDPTIEYTIRTIERLHTRKFADERDAFFLDAGSTYDPQIQITGIVESGTDIIITTDGAHSYQVGDVVEFSDIVWVPTIDILGNEEQPDALNGHRYVITAVTATTFTISCDGEVLS